MSCALRVNAATKAISPCPPLGVGSKTGLVKRRPFAFCCKVAARCWIAPARPRPVSRCGVVPLRVTPYPPRLPGLPSAPVGLPSSKSKGAAKEKTVCLRARAQSKMRL